MKEEFTNIEQIEKYLDGKMSPAEKQAFESSMDASTQNAIQNEMVVRKVVRGDRLLSLKEQMIKDLATKGTQGSNLFKPFIIGTTFVAALVGGGYFFIKDKPVIEPVVIKSSTPVTTDDHKELGKVTPEEDSSTEIFSGSENTVKETPETVPAVQTSDMEDAPTSSANTENEATIPTNSTVSAGGQSSSTTTNDYAEPDVEQLTTDEVEETSEADLTNTHCNSVAMNALMFALPSCDGQNNGKIFVFENSITGGKSPYTFSINDDKMSKKGEFSNLQNGEYKVSIIDANGCTSSKTKVITTSKGECIDANGYATFNPDKNETFNFPLHEDNSEVKVFDAHSNTIFESKIANKYHSSWDGSMNNGQTASTGVYVFEVTGPSKQKIKGYVIIK